MSALPAGCQTWTFFSAMDASLWTLSCPCMISFTRKDMKNESGLIKAKRELKIIIQMNLTDQEICKEIQFITVRCDITTMLDI